MACYHWKNNDLFLEIHLQPKASKDNISGLHGDRLKITITAQPIDNKANTHLIKFLAKLFRVPQKQVTIIRGEHSRDKTIRIMDPTKEFIQTTLENLI